MSDESDDEPPAADAPSPSLASSAPPPPHGQQMGAQQLSNHPVWVSARGRGDLGNGSAPPQFGRAGRGRGRGKGGSRPGSEAGDMPPPAPKFERISMAELEAKQYADADGADSAIQSDEDADDHWDRVKPAGGGHKSKRKKTGPREEAGEPGDSDDDDDDDDTGDRRRKLAGLMGAAAFGGGGGHYPRGGVSEAGSMTSANSSARRKDAFKDAFPVRGVTCVGCALANRIGPVNRFVKDNISLMTEDSLWKMAALCYKREVAEPTEREGAPVPPWNWKEIRCHYELHASGNFVARHKMIRQLQVMRQQQEQRLVRVDNGEKELDRQGADLMLKVRACSHGILHYLLHYLPHLLTIPHVFTDLRRRVERAHAPRAAAGQGQA
jgi:hypothetical protein